MEQSNQLNDMANYPQLIDRANKIGMCVSKVVYRGHHASEAIERAHIEATTRRTKMRVQADMAKEEQDLIDMRLDAQVKRESAERQIALDQANHKIKLEELAHKAVLTKQSHDAQMQLDTVRMQQEQQLKFERAKRDAKIEELKRLHDMGVDLTRYLVANGERPDKHIRFSGSQDE